jgi:hypothetical protein
LVAGVAPLASGFAADDAWADRTGAEGASEGIETAWAPTVDVSTLDESGNDVGARSTATGSLAGGRADSR